MDELLKQLSTLTPAVGIAGIFGYVLVKINAENLANHRDKTMAFLQDKSNDRELYREISIATADALKQFSISQQDVSKNLSLNTEALRDMRDALRKT